MKQYVAAVVGGLLASSCCLVQLALNVISVGCVGFNTVFSPYRPYLLALAMLGLAASFIVNIVLPARCSPSSPACSTKQTKGKTKRKGQGKEPACATKQRPAWGRFLITAAIILLLSFSPEILDEMNKNPTPLLTPLYVQLSSTTTKSCSDSHMLDPAQPKTRIFVDIQGMHCGACVARSRSALHAINACARVLLNKAGPGSITVHSDDAGVFTDERITSVIKEATFNATVLRREVIHEPVPRSNVTGMPWIIHSIANAALPMVLPADHPLFMTRPSSTSKLSP